MAPRQLRWGRRSLSEPADESCPGKAGPGNGPGGRQPLLRPAPYPGRALARATVVAVFLLMVLGNVVSATGSGLACPDWPLCHGRLVPPLRADVLIEYGHRLMAIVASAMLVATIVMTMRGTARPAVRRIGAALLALLGMQILLGGATVLLELPDLVSTAHLLNALLIFGGLIVLSGHVAATPVGGAGSGLAGDGGAAGRMKIRRLVAVGLGVLLVQLVLGGYVRHAGAGLACPDFPLCGGSVFPAHALGVVHWVHRWLGVALLAVFVHLGLVARRTAVAPGAAIVASLAVVQVTLGVLTVLLRLDPPVRAAHAAVGYTLWGALVWLSVRTGTWQPLLGDTEHGRPAVEAVRAF
jgi:heme A synthase